MNASSFRASARFFLPPLPLTPIGSRNRPRTHRILIKLVALRTFLEGAARREAVESANAGETESPASRAPMGAGAGVEDDAEFGTRPRLAAEVRSARNLDRSKLLEALEEQGAAGAAAGGEDMLLGFSVDEIASVLMRDTERALAQPREMEELQRVRQLVCARGEKSHSPPLHLIPPRYPCRRSGSV